MVCVDIMALYSILEKIQLAYQGVFKINHPTPVMVFETGLTKFYGN